MIEEENIPKFRLGLLSPKYLHKDSLLTMVKFEKAKKVGIKTRL